MCVAVIQSVCVECGGCSHFIFFKMELRIGCNMFESSILYEYEAVDVLRFAQLRDTNHVKK